MVSPKTVVQVKIPTVNVMRISLRLGSVQFHVLHFEIIILHFFEGLEIVRKLEFSACSFTCLNHTSMKAKSMKIRKYSVSKLSWVNSVSFPQFFFI
jgi:hypothetical protein